MSIYHMFSSKYSSFAYVINSLLFNPYRATLMRTLYRIPFITPLPFIAYPLSHPSLYHTPTFYFIFLHKVSFGFFFCLRKFFLKIGKFFEWRHCLVCDVTNVEFSYCMWRHERQVFIFFGTLNATMKNTKHTKKYNNKQNIFKTTARKL